MRWAAPQYHFLSLAEAAEAELPTERETQALDRLEPCHDDLRAALDWAIDREDGAFAVRLAGALSDFWRTRGHHTEVGSGSRPRSPTRAASRCIGARRWAEPGCWQLPGRLRVGPGLLEEALQLARDGGDQEAMRATSPGWAPTAMARGDIDDAQAYIAEGLDDPGAHRRRGGIAVSLNATGAGSSTSAATSTKPARCSRRASRSRWSRGTRTPSPSRSRTSGLVERDAGDTDRAAALFADAVSIWRRTGAEQRLVGRRAQRGARRPRSWRPRSGSGALEQALAMARELNDRPEVGYALTDLARVARAAGNLDAARPQLDEALRRPRPSRCGSSSRWRWMRRPRTSRRAVTGLARRA